MNAFLSPRIIRAIVDGNAPPGLTVTELAKTLSVPKIISGHIDDAGRLIRVLPLCSRTVGRLD
jgi:hypothetical protein